MSGIVLSASVRQNLLSLQSTADLLATTQNRLPRARRSTRPSITPPTSSPRSRSMRAPVTSTISSTVSATACRCCRPPTPASPRCRSWSTPPSRSPTRRCRARSATPPSRTSPPRSPARPRPTCAAPRATPARPRPPTCCSPARPAAPRAAASGTTLGGTSAPLVGTAAPNGAGTAASLAFGLTAGRRAQRHRRLRPTAQPTDGETLTVNGKTITFKSGSAPAAAAVPAGSGVMRQHRHRRQRQLHRLYRHDRHARRRTVQDLANAIDLASGVQKAVINTTTGVAAFSNSSGTNAAIAGGVLTLRPVPALTSASPAGPTC